jgi:hypothetical protein
MDGKGREMLSNTGDKSWRGLSIELFKLSYGPS